MLRSWLFGLLQLSCPVKGPVRRQFKIALQWQKNHDHSQTDPAPRTALATQEVLASTNKPALLPHPESP